MPDRSQPGGVGASLWRGGAYGWDEHHATGARYWLENAGRRDAEDCVAQLTLAGHIDLEVEGRVTPVGPGDLMVFAFGEDSRYGRRDPLPEPYRCRWLQLGGAGLREHLDALRAAHGSVFRHGLDHPLAEQFSQLVRDQSPAAEIPVTTQAHAVHRFVVALIEFADHRMLAGLDRTRAAIEALLRQPLRAWSLKRVAAEHGVTREHLSRRFSEHVGTPPHRYLTEQRRRRALTLIQHTALPMARVAEQAGFSSPHTLARQVHETMGCSPSALRRRCQDRNRSSRG